MSGLTAPEPGFSGLVGVARRDITPPLNVPVRSWGPATEDYPTGVHRPMTLTAVAFGAEGAEPLVLIGADYGWFKNPEDEPHVRGGALEAAGGDAARVLLQLSHTHSGPTPTLADGDAPSIAYLDAVRAAGVAASREAIASMVPGTFACATGRCRLAGDRDLPDGERVVVGFNPAHEADDTVVVGRVADVGGRILAVLVNYACHPTTLAWQNRLVSPDFVGAAREIVEGATGASCVFLQGASGELGPRHQYVGDSRVADRHGRCLGYAAMSALESMSPPGSELTYKGAVESGAALGMWEPAPYEAPATLAAETIEVDLPLRRMPTIEELQQDWADINPISLEERLRRARRVRAYYEGRDPYRFPIWIWRLGDCAVIGVPGEPYSLLQSELRRRHPGLAVLVLGVTNAEMSAYLPRDDCYDLDIYQAWQTPYERGCLERVLDAVDGALKA